MSQELDKQWHIDRKVPVAIILTFVLTTLAQVITAAWWAANVNSRLTALEKVIEAVPENRERIVKLELSLDYIKQALTRIEIALQDEQKKPDRY